MKMDDKGHIQRLEFERKHALSISQIAVEYKFLKQSISKAQLDAKRQDKSFYVLLGEDHRDRNSYLYSYLMLKICRELRISAYMPELHKESLQRARTASLRGNRDPLENTIALVHDADRLRISIAPVELHLSADQWSRHMHKTKKLEIAFHKEARKICTLGSIDGNDVMMVDDDVAFHALNRKYLNLQSKLDGKLEPGRIKAVRKAMFEHPSGFVTFGADHIRNIANAISDKANFYVINTTRIRDPIYHEEYVFSCIGTPFEGALNWLFDPKQAHQANDGNLDVSRMRMADIRRLVDLAVGQSKDRND